MDTRPQSRLLDFVVLAYLLPPIGLVAWGISAGDLNGAFAIFAAFVRLLGAAFLAFAIGFGIAQKITFLQKDGVSFHIRFFPLFVLLFVASVMMLGIEAKYGDPNEPIYRR